MILAQRSRIGGPVANDYVVPLGNTVFGLAPNEINFDYLSPAKGYSWEINTVSITTTQVLVSAATATFSLILNDTEIWVSDPLTANVNFFAVQFDPNLGLNFTHRNELSVKFRAVQNVPGAGGAAAYNLKYVVSGTRTVDNGY